MTNAGHLNAWLNEHRDNANKDAPLFVNLQGRRNNVINNTNTIRGYPDCIEERHRAGDKAFTPCGIARLHFGPFKACSGSHHKEGHCAIVQIQEFYPRYQHICSEDQEKGDGWIIRELTSKAYLL